MIDRLTDSIAIIILRKSMKAIQVVMQLLRRDNKDKMSGSYGYILS